MIFRRQGHAAHRVRVDAETGKETLAREWSSWARPSARSIDPRGLGQQRGVQRLLRRRIRLRAGVDRRAGRAESARSNCSAPVEPWRSRPSACALAVSSPEATPYARTVVAVGRGRSRLLLPNISSLTRNAGQRRNCRAGTRRLFAQCARCGRVRKRQRCRGFLSGSSTSFLESSQGDTHKEGLLCS